MSTTILSSLAAYIRRILGLRALGDATLHAFLDAHELNVPILPTEVEIFHAHYVRRASVTYRPVFPGEPDGALLRSARISSIKLMKAQKSPEHEYILAYVDTVDSNGHRFCLGILKCERVVTSDATWYYGALTRTDADSDATAAHNQVPTPPEPQALDHVSGEAESETIIIDQFTVYSPSTSTRTLSGRDRTVYRHDFPPDKQPPLEHLIAAACALHKAAKEQSVYRRQCFWFAGMVYRILVGPDAEDALAVDRRAVDAIIRHAGAETPAGGDANIELRRTVPEGKQQSVSGRTSGTFKDIFHIVTLADMAESYKAVEPVFTETTHNSRVLVMGTNINRVERIAHVIRNLPDSDRERVVAFITQMVAESTAPESSPDVNEG